MSQIDTKLLKLRNVINENLRTQLENDKVEYISSGHTLSDITARQSHCIFARRGCGKTLLLHHSRRLLGDEIKAVYINCEDFKHHSFPNVLIEIIDSIFSELERNLFRWFGKKKALRGIITGLRNDLQKLKSAPDEQAFDVRQLESEEDARKEKAGVTLGANPIGSIDLASENNVRKKADIELKYQQNENKLQTLNHKLPEFKSRIKEFFEISGKIKSVFIQLDDFYQLNRLDQPFVADYVHRLCKDTPLKFKLATLKHNSVLYIERNRQPIGIQERHDYQPINIDFTFDQFKRTRDQNLNIFLEYAKLAGMKPNEFHDLFKGKGFDRLVLAGGGVPVTAYHFSWRSWTGYVQKTQMGRLEKMTSAFLVGKHLIVGLKN